MKKTYVNPEIIITSFEAKDIINVSSSTIQTEYNTVVGFTGNLHS